MSLDYPVAAGTLLASTVAIREGSEWLERASERRSAYYGLPLVVQGAVVTAVGSSVPELASVVFTWLAGSPELGVGALVGSTISTILVIPATAGPASDDHVESSRSLVYEEAQFDAGQVSLVNIVGSGGGTR